VKKRVFFFLALFVLLVVANVPAVLLDTLIGRLSGNAIHLLDVEGTIWRGQGILVGRDAAQRSDQPWLHLRWKFLPADLLDGALGWSFADGGRVLGEASCGWRGVHLKRINLPIPAELVHLPLDNPVFKSGWRGDIALAIPEWSWQPGGIGRGQLDAVWRGAGSAFFPGRRLGDYHIKLLGEGERIRIAIQTLAGDVQISGVGSVAKDGQLIYDGKVRGDSALLSSLPSISGGMVRPGGEEGLFIVRIHAP
jgi:hypothetical protein